MITTEPLLAVSRKSASFLLAPLALILCLLFAAYKIAFEPIVRIVHLELDIVLIYTNYLAWDHHLRLLLPRHHHILTRSWIHHSGLTGLLHHWLPKLVYHGWWHHSRLTRHHGLLHRLSVLVHHLVLHHGLAGHLLRHHHLILVSFNLPLLNWRFRFLRPSNDSILSFRLHFDLHFGEDTLSTALACGSVLFVLGLAIIAGHLKNYL